MLKNLLCNARNLGLIPGQGAKITHGMGILSLQTMTTEPICQN